MLSIIIMSQYPGGLNLDPDNPPEACLLMILAVTMTVVCLLCIAAVVEAARGIERIILCTLLGGWALYCAAVAFTLLFRLLSYGG